MKRVLVTGADGFIGKNLLLRLRECRKFEVLPIVRASNAEDWLAAASRADAVVHLAGVNRPQDASEFAGNITSIEQLISALDAAGNTPQVILASSSKATESGPYGRSKKATEDALLTFSERSGAAVAIYRLPNVFGKWCRPHYNSAVATFCHNIARDLPITVNDPATPLDLVYIDDVIDEFLEQLSDAASFRGGFLDVQPTYPTTVGDVADLIQSFRLDRAEYRVAEVGVGFTRALYATYVSHLPPAEFAYPIKSYRDERGAFSEMLKTRTSGQFSYFSALPGVTRGGHYHHTKTEKFLVVYGSALFRFRHMLTDEVHELRTSAEDPVVVETIPGWAHDVTNVGDTIMISLLWANELFDRDHPDTVPAKVFECVD